jgi:ribonuclease HI
MPQPPGSSRLFPDPHAVAPAGVHIANIDGASRGNPGPASYALILKDPAGKVVFQLGKKIGRETNNVAEYFALLAALDYAAKHGIKGLRIRSDSELLVRQMQGRYKVKSPNLKPLHERASKLAHQLEYFVIEHIPRELNRDADALANLALDDADSSALPNPNSQAGQPPAATSRPRSPQASAGPSEASSARLSRNSPGSGSRTIRARFVEGALIPSEPLDLPEGAEVTLTVRTS